MPPTMAAATTELATAEGKLTAKTGLASAEGKLASAEGKLASAKTELAAAKMELAAAKTELAAAKTEDEKKRANQAYELAYAGAMTTQKGVETAQSAVDVAQKLVNSLIEPQKEIAGADSTLANSAYSSILREIKTLRTEIGRASLKMALGTLNPWAMGPSDSVRSEAPGFRDAIEKYYGTRNCMLTGLGWHDVGGQGLVGAHLWPKRSNERGVDLLGLKPRDIAEPRNGLLLCSGIEKAFDRLEVCFLPDVNKDLCLHVLDDKLKDYDYVTYVGLGAKSPKSSRNFGALNGKKLISFERKPFRRILWLHAYCAIGHMEKNTWTPCSPFSFTLESDRAYRKLSEDGPFKDLDEKDDDQSASEYAASDAQSAGSDAPSGGSDASAGSSAWSAAVANLGAVPAEAPPSETGPKAMSGTGKSKAQRRREREKKKTDD